MMLKLPAAMLFVMALLMTACASTPAPAPRPVVVAPEPVACVPEPEPEVEAPVVDLSPEFRDAQALYAVGDSENAMLAYERLLAKAEKPEDQLNSLIALAMLRLLPSSSVSDLAAATLIIEEIEKRLARNDLYYRYFGQIELLQQIRQYEQNIANLKSASESLQADLARKEEAIRALKEVIVDDGS